MGSVLPLRFCRENLLAVGEALADMDKASEAVGSCPEIQ